MAGELKLLEEAIARIEKKIQETKQQAGDKLYTNKFYYGKLRGLRYSQATLKQIIKDSSTR